MPFNSRTLYGNGNYGRDWGNTQGSKVVINLGSISSASSNCYAYFTTT